MKHDDAPSPPTLFKVLWPALLYLVVVFLYLTIDILDDDPVTLPDPPPPTVDIDDILPPAKKDDPIVVVLNVNIPKVAPAVFGKTHADLIVNAWKGGSIHAKGKASPSSLTALGDGLNKIEVEFGVDLMGVGISRFEALLHLDYTQPYGGKGTITRTFVAHMSGVKFAPDALAEFSGSELVFPVKVTRFAGTALTAGDTAFELASEIVVTSVDDPDDVLAQAYLDDSNFALTGGGGVFDGDDELLDAEAQIRIPVEDFDTEFVSVEVSLWIDGKFVTRQSVYEIE